MSPFGEVMTSPTPPIPLANDLFVCIVHNSDLLTVLSSGMVNLAMKFVNT